MVKVVLVVVVTIIFKFFLSLQQKLQYMRMSIRSHKQCILPRKVVTNAIYTVNNKYSPRTVSYVKYTMQTDIV